MPRNEKVTRPGRHPLLIDFPVIAEAEVRWGEMDSFGHVNNIYFFRYFEIARIAYFDAIGFREGARIGPILGHTDCRFRRPLHYPDHLWIGARVKDVREDRFIHEYAIVKSKSRHDSRDGKGRHRFV